MLCCFYAVLLFVAGRAAKKKPVAGKKNSPPEGASCEQALQAEVRLQGTMMAGTHLTEPKGCKVLVHI